tara:strand:+ start:209 stop:499 length:291 start_codon:yes stop_codon:yes gene_type:complete
MTTLREHFNKVIVKGTLIQHKSRIMREPIKGIVQEVRKNKGAWNNLFLIRWLEGPEWNREERLRRINPQWLEEREIAFGTGYSILSGYIPMYPEEE